MLSKYGNKERTHNPRFVIPGGDDELDWVFDMDLITLFQMLVINNGLMLKAKVILSKLRSVLFLQIANANLVTAFLITSSSL